MAKRNERTGKNPRTETRENINVEIAADINAGLADMLKRLKLIMEAEAPAVKAGISGSLAAALDDVASHPGKGVAAVAEVLGITVASASALVNKLVEKNLITKKESSLDGRAVELHVTAKGNGMAMRIRNYRNSFAGRMLDCFTEKERAVFIELFKKAIESVSA